MLARESQIDMKKAKRMTLFIIMINVSRNGIKAIMKNDPIKYFKNKTKVWASDPTAKSDYAHVLQVCLYDRPHPNPNLAIRN